MHTKLLKVVVAGVFAAAACTAQAQEDGQVVSRDPVTGQLRAPTPEEHAKLEKIKQDKARNFRTAPAPTYRFIHKSGARGISAPDDSISTSVAVIRDGKLEQECFDSPEAAAEAMKKGIVRPQANTASE